ncbi:sodium:solute symporter family transporter [Fodinibius salsisoli]|uniref:Sodium/solute symporter n=1 Tax=Fodinibius salsisoli TaxID=2820877 RepID=A0ABT3PL34_9BACT|nr:sodium/solute symporter [Fodinibius salsisoli]MCW9706468.1 sodium/solute symporter [Fodinibius salsisoli]
MTILDVAIIAIYLLFISWRGLREAQSHQNTDDFFLAGRSLSWPLIGLSLFATNISITSIIGLASSGYKTGISVFNYEWVGSVMLVIFAIFIAPFYLKYRLTTMPEYLERRYDHRSRLFFSVIAITVNIFIDIAGALYASSLFLSGIFPSLDLHILVFIMALITGLYTVLGGLRAVIVTDSIQAVLLTAGSIIIAFVVYQKTGWQEIHASIDANLLSLIRPVDDTLIPWPTLIISLPILAFYFMCTNQHMVQRILGARSVDDGRKGAIFAAFLKLPLLFMLILPGTAARLIYPELENTNLVYPFLMYDFLPAGILGIVLTGFIAALMSSIDSALTAASSIATMDIYRKFRPQSSQRHLINMGKVFIMVAVFIASLWAPFIEQFPTLWEYLQALLSYLSPPVVTCFIFGLFWRKATSQAAFTSLWMGSLVGLMLLVNNHFWDILPTIHYLYSATIIFLFSSSILVISSYLDTSKTESTLPEVDKKEIFAQPLSLPWYKGYPVFAWIVCICTTIIVLLFW